MVVQRLMGSGRISHGTSDEPASKRLKFRCLRKEIDLEETDHPSTLNLSLGNVFKAQGWIMCCGEVHSAYTLL